jgi:hypothetical protein
MKSLARSTSSLWLRRISPQGHDLCRTATVILEKRWEAPNADTEPDFTWVLAQKVRGGRGRTHLASSFLMLSLLPSDEWSCATSHPNLERAGRDENAFLTPRKDGGVADQLDHFDPVEGTPNVLRSFQTRQGCQKTVGSNAVALDSQSWTFCSPYPEPHFPFWPPHATLSSSIISFHHLQHVNTALRCLH